MPTPDAASFSGFVNDHNETIEAIAIVAFAILLAKLVDRALLGRGHRIGEAVAGRPLSPGADTRLRLVRRLVLGTIIMIGIAFALIRFPAVKEVATGILASSAVLGLVVGFAARQTLANAIAGILIAITQPIRVGDLVTFEEETGTVEDIRLAYTSIRCDDGRRLVVPNERLAQSTVINHTVVDPRVQVEISVWIPPGGDADRALAVLVADEGVEARVAEVDKEGIRLAVTAWADSPLQRGPLASRLRRESLARLRAESGESLSSVGTD